MWTLFSLPYSTLSQYHHITRTYILWSSVNESWVRHFCTVFVLQFVEKVLLIHGLNPTTEAVTWRFSLWLRKKFTGGPLSFQQCIKMSVNSLYLRLKPSEHDALQANYCRSWFESNYLICSVTDGFSDRWLCICYVDRSIYRWTKFNYDSYYT